jgi:bifunctional aspartokinase / homoserine dehydrogenase 1
MIVLKFGGSSVSSPQRIGDVIEILKKYYNDGKNFCVIFSAFGGVTDDLILVANQALNGEDFEKNYAMIYQRHKDAIAYFKLDKVCVQKVEAYFDLLLDVLKGISLIKELSPKTLDLIMSFGERNSSLIIAHALKKHLPASYLDASTVVFTDGQYNKSKVDFNITNKAIQSHFENIGTREVVCITGFIGNHKNTVTTLGRGGSDYTASIFGAALHAKSVEIWTDVNGVLTADPRKVKNTFTLDSMTYIEAMEMSHFGAKVIYPPTLVPIYQKNIPLVIKNTFNPSHKGTYISNKAKDSKSEIKGISSISNIDLLTISGSGMFGVPGSAGRLFSSLAKADVNVILITQGSSEQSISFAIDPKSSHKALDAINYEFSKEMKENEINSIQIDKNLSVVAIIGENMKFKPGIAGKMFNALGKNGVNIHAIAQGSSEFNVSVVVDNIEETKALNTLHDAFFLSDFKTIHMFIVGYGLIGKTLMRQISKQSDFLKKNHSLKINIVAISNTKQMHFDEAGIEFSQIENVLLQSKETANLDLFVDKMIEMNLSNAIFLDNTADENPPKYYEKILNESISIVTPNKIATSSSYAKYLNLKNIAKNRNINFLYETNVGAGLPLLSTINDLVLSGDKILKIEAILSGSLSFIFNNFSSKNSFFSILSKAKELGYTEPDPRIDLTGKDVSRKVLILAREIGIKLEVGDILIESFLPQDCIEASTVEEFMALVSKNNAYFQQLVLNAEKNNKVLRFVAEITKSKSTIKLKSFGKEHPFYMLSGSDNMIVLTTERYKERPLVIRGPGAGAEVTAAGVFADIIKIANYISK